jgi:hypothetical protein
MHACTRLLLFDPTHTQDPSIKEMAEQIANDPSFMGMTQQLQETMAGMMGGAGGAGGAGGMPPGMPGMPAGGGMPDPANFDPSKYMQAMSGMFSNPDFMKMAEKLGQAIIQVCVGACATVSMMCCVCAHAACRGIDGHQAGAGRGRCVEAQLV